ncbi:MAG TPA: F0F1 ATP synthase subunit delta [Candidatus Saccharimonadales bacterium]
MISLSRRRLAQYAVDEILAELPAADLSARLAAALIATNRRNEIDLLLSDIDQELEERRLLVRAHLTSAYWLSEKLKHELMTQLKKMTQTQEVVLREEVDKSVIGGIRVETATRSWDMTIRRTLNKLKEAA